ncbi:Ubiquitin-conjugating enzyme E2-24 kDa [Mycena sanguinolenta]|uniref:Ubiquitin-conjugating enzyme E2-24 kDa n=1 Tax=Mycena sanguinolenta TaxID=230812 RepID=A0A8H6YG25_9AGAR|nr:Ubiquitin-conjugating enzyme E2-24 kDa [Mycena sanguinolenta]
MDARLRRVNKEIADCKNDKTSGIRIELVDSSPFHLKGSFPGPEDTPYQGGLFEVVFVLIFLFTTSCERSTPLASRRYAPSPPTCARPLCQLAPHLLEYDGRHTTQDIVIPDSYPFAPVKMKFITKVYHPNVSSASGAICLDILKDACPSSAAPSRTTPQDAEVAKHYTTSKRSFEETATYWTRTYAMPHNAGGVDSVKVAAAAGTTERDEIAIAGLERAHVERFEALGFSSAKVVGGAFVLFCVHIFLMSLLPLSFCFPARCARSRCSPSPRPPSHRITSPHALTAPTRTPTPAPVSHARVIPLSLIAPVCVTPVVVARTDRRPPPPKLPRRQRRADKRRPDRRGAVEVASRLYPLSSMFWYVPFFLPFLECTSF